MVRLTSTGSGTSRGAYALLREALEAEVKDLSQLERDGMIRRGQATSFELALVEH